MQAVKFCLSTKLVELVGVPIPTISNPNEVLIKVAYAGICGTDLHIMHGQFSCNKDRPFTLGHESSGFVHEVGSGVTLFKKGDRVAINPCSGCGKCDFCHIGSYNYCKDGGINTGIGLQKDGGWAEYVLVPDDQIYKMPDTVTLEQAALAEPISCLTRGWDLISPVPVGQKILVIGAGIIGNLFAAMLHLQGHRNVTIFEIYENRLNLVQANTGFECIVTEQQSVFSDELKLECIYDVVMDCSGAPRAIEDGFKLLKPGGKLCLFGVPKPYDKISISPFDIIIKEVRIYGVNINPFTFPKAMGLIEAMGDRYLNYEKLGVKTFALKDFRNAIKMLEKREITKAVFKL